MLPGKKPGRKETRQALYCRDCGAQQAVSGQKAGDRRVPRLRIEGETDTVSGWGPNMATGAVLTDIPSGDVLLRGLPVQQRNEKLLSGLAVIDLPTGKLFGMFEFTAGCTETYDVQFLPGARNVSVLNLTDNAVRQALSAPDFSYGLRLENMVSDSSRFRSGITNPGWTNCIDISGSDAIDFGSTTTSAVAVHLGVTTTQVVNANLSLRKLQKVSGYKGVSSLLKHGPVPIIIMPSRSR